MGYGEPIQPVYDREAEGFYLKGTVTCKYCRSDPKSVDPSLQATCTVDLPVMEP